MTTAHLFPQTVSRISPRRPGEVILLQVLSFLAIAIPLSLAGGVFSLRFSGIDPRMIARTGTTSDQIQMIYGVSYIILISYGFFNFQKFKNLILRNWILIIVPIYAIISSLWAPLPEISFRKSTALLAGVLAVHAIVSILGGQKTFIFIARFFVFFVFVSFIYVLIDPIYAIHQQTDGYDATTHVGQWRGVYVHRTVLGRTSAISIGLLLACGREALGQRWLVWAALAVSTLTLIMADSGGAFASAALLAAAPYALYIYRNATPLARPRIFLIYVLAGISALILFPILLGAVLTILGKSQTLTGRVPMWAPLLASALERPLQGFGYSTGFSYTVALELNARTGIGFMPNAQNGYLDTVLNLGLIGLSALLFSMIRAFRVAIRVATEFKSYGEIAWRILPFIMMLFYFEVNTVEAWMVEPTNIMVLVLFMTIAAIRSIEFEGEPGERRRLNKMTDGDRRAAARR